MEKCCTVTVIRPVQGSAADGTAAEVELDDAACNIIMHALNRCASLLVNSQPKAPTAWQHVINSSLNDVESEQFFMSKATADAVYMLLQQALPEEPGWPCA